MTRTVRIASLRDAETEAGYQQAIIEAARLLGWMVFHPHRSDHSESGYPDLTMCRPGQPGQLAFLEVKRSGGKPRPEQVEWVKALGTVPGVVTAIARPGDWEEVESVLRHGMGTDGREAAIAELVRWARGLAREHRYGMPDAGRVLRLCDAVEGTER